MRIHLLNSAVMPQEGIYSLKQISKETFVELLRRAYEEGKLLSYIGYEQNRKIIEQIANIRVPMCRDNTILNDGDEILIMKLKRRLTSAELKASNYFQNSLKVEDFEFFICKFTNKIKEE